jgi:hypothetical protein
MDNLRQRLELDVTLLFALASEFLLLLTSRSLLLYCSLQHPLLVIPRASLSAALCLYM